MRSIFTHKNRYVSEYKKKIESCYYDQHQTEEWFKQRYFLEEHIQNMQNKKLECLHLRNYISNHLPTKDIICFEKVTIRINNRMMTLKLANTTIYCKLGAINLSYIRHIPPQCTRNDLLSILSPYNGLMTVIFSTTQRSCIQMLVNIPLTYSIGLSG